MLDFIIVGMPRSGTTWAANWLTTEHSLCVHDPLHTMHYKDWDRESAKWDAMVTGVACTGIWRWTDWLNAHPAKKLVLRRDFDEVAASMRELGMPPPLADEADLLDNVVGLHVDYKDLFDPVAASYIWEYLFTPANREYMFPGEAFSKERHNQLRQMEVQPMFGSREIDHELQHQLALELSSLGSRRPCMPWVFVD